MKRYTNRRSLVTFLAFFLSFAVLSGIVVVSAYARSVEREEADWNRQLEHETERAFIYLEQHMQSAVRVGNSIFGATWYKHYRNVAKAYEDEFTGLKRLEVVSDLAGKVYSQPLLDDLVIITPSMNSVIIKTGWDTLNRWRLIYSSDFSIDASGGYTAPAVLTPRGEDVCLMTLQDFNGRRDKTVIALQFSKKDVTAAFLAMLGEHATGCEVTFNKQTLVAFGENRPKSVSIARASRSVDLQATVYYESYREAGRSATILTYAALLLAVLCASALLALVLTWASLRPVNEMITRFGGETRGIDDPYRFIYAYVDAFARQSERQSRENDSLRQARRHFLSLMRNEMILGMLTNPDFDFEGEYIRYGFPWIGAGKPFLIAACTPKQTGADDQTPPAERYLTECENSCYAGLDRQRWYLYWFSDEQALENGRELLENRLQSALHVISDTLYRPEDIHGAYLSLRKRLEEEKRSWLTLPTMAQGKILSRVYSGRREESAQAVAEALDEYNPDAVLWLLVQVAGDCGFDAGEYLLRYRALVQESGSEAEVRALLTELPQALCRFLTADRPSVAAETAGDICRYIEENFANPEMSVNFLADHFSMHRTLISKAVKAQTGETFSDYLMKLRMARALELIEEGTLNFQQIGEQIGLLSYPTFKRAFVKIYGCTPSEWHKSA